MIIVQVQHFASPKAMLGLQQFHYVLFILKPSPFLYAFRDAERVIGHHLTLYMFTKLPIFTSRR